MKRKRSLSADEDSFILFPDILNMIYEYCEPLVVFMMQPRHPSIARRLKASLHDVAGIENVDEFLDTLKIHDGVIAGSYLLHFLYGDEGLMAADVDIFVKHKNAGHYGYRLPFPNLGHPNDLLEIDYADILLPTTVYQQFPLKKPIQFILIKEDPHQHVAKFDTACLKLFYDGGARLHTADGFSLEELQAKQYAPPSMPKNLYRVAKYVKKGFSLSQKVADWLRKRKFKKPEDSWDREMEAYTYLRSRQFFVNNRQTLRDDIIDFLINPEAQCSSLFDSKKCNYCETVLELNHYRCLYLRLWSNNFLELYGVIRFIKPSGCHFVLGNVCEDCSEFVETAYSNKYKPCYNLLQPLLFPEADAAINEFLAPR